MILQVFEHNYLTWVIECSKRDPKSSLSKGQPSERIELIVIKSKNCNWCLDHSVKLTYFHLILLFDISPRFGSVIHGYTVCTVRSGYGRARGLFSVDAERLGSEPGSVPLLRE